MEGSVKNLLEAENEAKQIVEEAMGEKNRLLQNANVIAQQEINARKQKWEKKLADDAEKVRSSNKIVNIIFARSQLAEEKEAFDKAQERNEIELAEINDQYNRNKDVMIESLLDQVMDVKLEVPRVVKQKEIKKEEIAWE